MITIENRDDYITIESNRSIHDAHMSACRYIHSCAVISRIRQSAKKEQLQDARNFVESTRLLVNLIKRRSDAQHPLHNP